MHLRAFISYSTTDKRFAGAAKVAFDKVGIDSFLAHDDLTVSEEWKTRIVEELKRADVFVAILSKSYRTSEWCDQEVGFIVSRPEVLIVPLSTDDTTPYGFIAHIQGQRVADPSAVRQAIEAALFRKRPRVMIPKQIERVRSAGSYRGGEAAVEPLVPLFNTFTGEEIASFIDAATGNSEVWDASLCKLDYLPRFLTINQSRMSEEERAKLEEVLK